MRVARVESFRQFQSILLWNNDDFMQRGSSDCRQAFQNDLWVLNLPSPWLPSVAYAHALAAREKWPDELGLLLFLCTCHLFLACNESLRIWLQTTQLGGQNDVEFSIAVWLFVFLFTAGFNNSRNSLAPVKGFLNHTVGLLVLAASHPQGADA